jgi:hypothetical protein
MAEVGTGVLPFSIMPPEAPTIAASRAPPLDNSQAETYNMSGEPTMWALSTAETQRLRNQKGYLPVIWMERTQIRCTLDLQGAFYRTEHPIPAGRLTVLREYESGEVRLQHEIDTYVGSRLGPSLFKFHLQLIIRDWFVEHTRMG